MKTLILLLAMNITIPSLASSASDTQFGYHWYEDPTKDETAAKVRQPLPPPPSSDQLMKAHPEEIEAMLQTYLKEAVWLLTPESVLNYYRIQDVARRKAAGFTALAGLVMLENPQLSGKSQYPTSQPGTVIEAKTKNETIRRKLISARQRYGLAMFTSPKCPYCPTQRNTLQYFQDQNGWEITEIDIATRPELQARFNVSVTPMVIVIERNSDQWMPVGVGIQTVSEVEINTYRAVRYLDGDVSPQQFLTPDHKLGGFMDPTASEG